MNQNPVPRVLPVVLGVALGLTLAAPPTASPEEVLAYIGTRATEPGRGISIATFDTETGKLGTPKLAAEAPAPNFFVLSKDSSRLYSINALPEFEGQPSGAVSAYAVDRATGALTLLNRKPTGGPGPAHVSLDRDEHHVLVANYTKGNIAVFALEKDGWLGARTAFVQHEGRSVNPERQAGPHAHCIKVDPSNRFVLVTDLGLDRILIYRFDAKKGTLTPNATPFAATAPGAGPRHMSFHPNGRFLYLVNEMGGTVTAFAWDSKLGKLTELQTLSSLPAGFSGENNSAEIEVHPNGRFLYATNRGPDSIAAFAVDPASGRLSLTEIVPAGGKTPRNFAIDPSGKWLVVSHHGSDTDAVFRIDPATGRLTPVGEPVAVPFPFCVRFLVPRPATR